jgi:hypothetical protein
MKTSSKRPILPQWTHLDLISAKLPEHSIMRLPNYVLKVFPLRVGCPLFIWGDDSWTKLPQNMPPPTREKTAAQMNVGASENRKGKYKLEVSTTLI